tara:strand:+ start:375 stop:653 length:279 start_codon:yes stop_codon:yes gene_type:complete
MGPDALWLTEFLLESLTLEPGMRFLDHGCGMGMTSIFLAWEFGMEVWANDLRISAENSTRRFSVSGSVDQINEVHPDLRAVRYETEKRPWIK